jgi:TonB family protein
MPNPTEGMSPPLVEETLVERAENPLPKVDEIGQPGFQTEMRRLTEGADDFVDPVDRVQMSRPAQRSLQFVLLHSVSPEYPDGVSPGLRRREVVVRVNLFVDEQGRVAHAYVDRNNGGPLFEDAVLVAVRQWIYRPLEIDGKPQGFWDHIYFVFNMAPTPRERG